MQRILFFLVLLTSLNASAQKVLKRPLEFVVADSIFVLPKGDHNIIMDIMAVAPFASPHPIVATKADVKEVKRNTDVDPQLPLREAIYEHAKRLLMTGDAHYAEILSNSYFRTFPHTLADATIYSRADREGAAQHILNLTGTIIATDNKRDVYVNLFENCVCRIHTQKFRMLLDIVSQYPEGPMVKLRIDGLEESNTPFALHIRIPEHGAANKYFVNGHEIIRPVIENGYLVIDRKWHNGEEVYFILQEL